MPNLFESRCPGWGSLCVPAVVALTVLASVQTRAEGSGYVTLEWEPSTDPEVVGYVVEHGETPGNYTSQEDASNAIIFTVWDLEVGQTYYFSVRAYTATGLFSDSSNEEVGQAQYPDGTVVPPPAAPSGLTAAVDASHALAQVINLAWTDNSNSEDRFIVERALDGVTFQYLGQTPAPDVRSYADASVLPDTTYSYRVVAQATNGGNSPPSGIASATTSATPNTSPTSNAGGPYSSEVGQEIVFDARGSSDPDGDPLTFTWDFGDGRTATGPRPRHSYASAGNVTPTLFVSDGNGGSDLDTATAAVQAQTGITLSARRYKVRGRRKVDLTWSGLTSHQVDIYRNGARIATVPKGATPYTDSVGKKRRGSYTYRVCEAGTSVCSNDDTVRF